MAETHAAAEVAAVSAKSNEEKTKIAGAGGPPVSIMVLDALSSMEEKGGSTLVAIRNFIAEKYKPDMVPTTDVILKYLKSKLEVPPKGSSSGTSKKATAGRPAAAQKAAAIKTKKDSTKKTNTNEPEVAPMKKIKTGPGRKAASNKSAEKTKKAARTTAEKNIATYALRSRVPKPRRSLRILRKSTALSELKAKKAAPAKK